MSKIQIFSIEEIIGSWYSIDASVSSPDEQSIRSMWINLMEKKRKDTWYPRVLHSIEENGLVGVLAVQFADGIYWHLDGHHRFTAMYDLGFTHIPYLVDEDENWTPYLSSGRVGTGFHEDIITRTPARV